MTTYKGLSIVIEHEAGLVESVRLLKSRSGIPEPLLEDINNGLKQAFAKPILPTKTIIEIGNLAEQQVLDHLQKIAQASRLEVFDRSSEAGHGDLSVTHKGMNICIEVKNYKTALPMKEIDKYHKSLSLEEYDAGIIICIQKHGYAKAGCIRTPIDIRYHKNKPSIYLSGVDLELLYSIIEIARSMIQTKNRTRSQLDIDELLAKISAIQEKVADMKSIVDAQKKLTIKLEKAIEEICLI